jgi:uncharacterized protein YprB with RNaseH-like and TPR domain
VRAEQVGRLSRRRVSRLRGSVVESIQKYEGADWNFFENAMPSRHKWRAFGELRAGALYVDIETDGGMGPGAITVIGTYDGKTAKTFVQGIDLDDAAKVIAAHPLVVTFNGASFDMPLIRSRFPQMLSNHIHVDLRYPLRGLGYTGGLKEIERAVGLRRSSGTAGLDGWDAVRLWRDYRFGSREALDVLLEYNREDIIHLKPLMELAYEGLKRQLREVS